MHTMMKNYNIKKLKHTHTHAHTHARALKVKKCLTGTRTRIDFFRLIKQKINVAAAYLLSYRER